VKAVVWHGKEDVRVDNVPDPTIQESTDAIVRITSTAICGSDLHLFAKLSPLMREGDIIGHEPMGIVEEVGADVEYIAPGDRVVIPFNISCGHCYFCDQELYSQCETTRDTGLSKYPKDPRTSGSCTSPTSCRRAGRLLPTRIFPRAGPQGFGVSARSARCAPA
jgi:threonine dehydrogenase-like Zn-dependent dehydrogenase